MRLVFNIVRRIVWALWTIAGRPSNIFAKALWTILFAILFVEAIGAVWGSLAILITDYDLLRDLADGGDFDLDNDALFDGQSESGWLAAAFGKLTMIIAELVTTACIMLICWAAIGGLAHLIETADRILYRLEADAPDGAPDNAA